MFRYLNPNAFRRDLILEWMRPNLHERGHISFTIALVLALSVIIAWGSTSLGALTQNMITFNTYFGAVVFLTFFWRRLTVPAILIGFFIWMALWAASATVPWLPAAARSKLLR